MSLSVGIVGLPNVGKSTLFQAITKKQVECQNYPFCTIEPNIGVAPVADERVDKLTLFSKSAKKIYSVVEFHDIAGLVEGANKGEGLGNQFLGHIRETDLLVLVLRIFQNDKIVNTREEINPLKDKEILETEMALKDLSTLEKRLEGLESEIRQNKKGAAEEKAALEKAKNLLDKNIFSLNELSESELEAVNSLQLLSFKPKIFLLNGKKSDLTAEVESYFTENKLPFLLMDIAEEADTAQFDQEERKELGLPLVSTLDLLIKNCYQELGLISFLTTGEKETRAWTIRRGARAPEAGGAIHSDFEKNFIKAEIISWQELLESGSFAKARERGLLRLEGKDYVVKDGDVIEFKVSP